MLKLLHPRLPPVTEDILDNREKRIEENTYADNISRNVISNVLDEGLLITVINKTIELLESQTEDNVGNNKKIQADELVIAEVDSSNAPMNKPSGFRNNDVIVEEMRFDQVKEVCSLTNQGDLRIFDREDTVNNVAAEPRLEIFENIEMTVAPIQQFNIANAFDDDSLDSKDPGGEAVAAEPKLLESQIGDSVGNDKKIQAEVDASNVLMNKPSGFRNNDVIEEMRFDQVKEVCSPTNQGDLRTFDREDTVNNVPAKPRLEIFENIEMTAAPIQQFNVASAFDDDSFDSKDPVGEAVTVESEFAVDSQFLHQFIALEELTNPDIFQQGDPMNNNKLRFVNVQNQTNIQPEANHQETTAKQFQLKDSIRLQNILLKLSNICENIASAVAIALPIEELTSEDMRIYSSVCLVSSLIILYLLSIYRFKIFLLHDL